MAAIGLIRLSVAAALRDLGQPATCRQVAACAQVGIQATRWALSNMLRDGEAANDDLARVRRVDRPAQTHQAAQAPSATAADCCAAQAQALLVTIRGCLRLHLVKGMRPRERARATHPDGRREGGAVWVRVLRDLALARVRQLPKGRARFLARLG